MLLMRKGFRINLPTSERICSRFKTCTNCQNLVFQSKKVYGSQNRQCLLVIIASPKQTKIANSRMMTNWGMDRVVVNLMEKILTQLRSLMAGTKVTRRRKVGEMTIHRAIGSKEEAT